jgi:MFS family permease
MLRVYVSVASIILSTLILQLGNGMIGPTVVLRASAQGEGAAIVGLIPAAYGVGFIVGCFWGRRLIAGIGHIRAFSVAAGLLAALAIAMQLVPETHAWIALRGVMGACIAVISTCADSWVGNSTPGNLRGRILALYSVSIKFAHLGAPALLALVAAVNAQAVLYAGLLFALSLLPVALTRLPAPVLDAAARLSTRNLLAAAPSAFVACFAVGLGNGSLLNLLPAQNLAVGLTAAEALALLTAAHVGGLLLQWPIGYLSDAADRRFAISGALLAAAGLALAMHVAPLKHASAGLGLAFLWGGFALSVYSICLAHAIDHVERGQIVATCATLLVTWSSGAVLGPALAGAAMQWFGADALFVFAAVCHGGAALFVLYRLAVTARRRRQGDFVNVPVTSAELYVLDPRRPAEAAEASR